MSRMRKHFERREAFRDAKLVFIAVEGMCTEKIYFEKLAKEYKNPQTKVIVVPRDTTDSAPIHILNNLMDKLLDYDKLISDEVYVVIDRDAWKAKMMADVEKTCFEKGFSFIVSNPCFELWLLLHVDDVSVYSAEEKDLIKQNKRVSRARKAKKHTEKLLSEKMAGFNKTSEASIKKFIPHVNMAIINAEKLNSPYLTERGWPKEVGTQVHYLANKIINP